MATHVEVLSRGATPKILAQGGTRAGLMNAALKGMFLAMYPELPAEPPESNIERPFSCETASFEGLLAGVLDAALEQAREHGERYDDISFGLITDKKAEGKFVGHPAQGEQVVVLERVERSSLTVAKKDTGEWEATVAFTTA